MTCSINNAPALRCGCAKLLPLSFFSPPLAEELARRAHSGQAVLVRAPSRAKVNAALVCAINHIPNCDAESFLLLLPAANLVPKEKQKEAQ